ncbi:uncharacterized protein PHALS_07515 [Plasmopara halstedii]|uniref:Uncharacterized protein n=1 Tax=Plasmopara halstedii TaxID=4781 RepID=A0A0P1B5V1_PLAHL|nr:uncharacterized protein PHALS_07515 [Plasmopara halstedii]CEG49769.1 hypothetical protein PHALS_07515 [Plasmopara halstedii]|eukprot:XP_024586138.1 hypothetical protein PHALS_07515 [Plasmopara halstedii]
MFTAHFDGTSQKSFILYTRTRKNVHVVPNYVRTENARERHTYRPGLEALGQTKKELNFVDVQQPQTTSALAVHAALLQIQPKVLFIIRSVSNHNLFSYETHWVSGAEWLSSQIILIWRQHTNALENNAVLFLLLETL